MSKTELDFVKPMFDAIAPRYDFLNRLLSGRQDVLWRRKMIRALSVPRDGKVLDVACGTGDVMLEVLRQKKAGHVYGLDFAPEMLNIAKVKVRQAYPAGAPVHFITGNGLSLPFPARTFDAVTIAFGIRNIIDRQSALTCFHHVLKPGGMLAVLELATPASGFFRSLYLFYFQTILPTIGGLFSKNIRAYQYLPDSVLHFPPAATFAGLIAGAGFGHVQWEPLTMGIATLYTAVK